MGAALQRAGGRVLGNGPINVAVNVREGDDSEQIAGTATGLVDVETDEIHVFIRSHGPPNPDPAVLQAQVTTPGGGCNTELAAGTVPTSMGECATVGVAVHLP